MDKVAKIGAWDHNAAAHQDKQKELPDAQILFFDLLRRNIAAGQKDRGEAHHVKGEDGEEQTFKIVTSIRGNSIKNMISNESPIGKAIMGKKVGSRVKIKVNDSYSYYVVIKNIDKSTDDSNDIISKF